MRYQINSFEELDTQTLYEILSHRFEVFMLEQRCIYHDFDPFDKTALHMTAWDDAGNLVGYVRLLPAKLHYDGYEENSFGRLSVKASARHQGVGGELVRRACAWLTSHGAAPLCGSPPWPIWRNSILTWNLCASRMYSTRKAFPM